MENELIDLFNSLSEENQLLFIEYLKKLAYDETEEQ